MVEQSKLKLSCLFSAMQQSCWRQPELLLVEQENGTGMDITSATLDMYYWNSLVVVLVTVLLPGGTREWSGYTTSFALADCCTQRVRLLHSRQPMLKSSLPTKQCILLLDFVKMSGQ